MGVKWFWIIFIGVIVSLAILFSVNLVEEEILITVDSKEINQNNYYIVSKGEMFRVENAELFNSLEYNKTYYVKVIDKRVRLLTEEHRFIIKCYGVYHGK